MYILLSDKRFPSSETRGNLVYKKFLKKKIKLIETSDWFKSPYFKFLIILKIVLFIFSSYKEKKIICLKFTPLLLIYICKFLGAKIIYDCDDTIWIDSHFGKKKSYKIFKLSNLIVFENFFLKRNFDKFFFDKFNNQIINCTLPDYKIDQNNNRKINKFIPTFCYIGSLWNFKEILPLLSKIDSYNLPWNLNLLGSSISKNDYKNLINLNTLENYNTFQMCQFMEISDIGIYSKAFSPFNRGRGFHKKLLYLSRGLPIVSIFSFDRKIHTKSHILLNDCWSDNKILIKSLELKNLKIIDKWNSYIYKKFKSIIN